VQRCTCCTQRRPLHLVGAIACRQISSRTRAARKSRSLGETVAAKCLGKFCRHHKTSGVMLTAEGWQNRYENWVEDEHVTALPRNSAPAARPPVAAGVIIHRGTPQADAWEKHNGKRFLWGIRSVATTPTEWPPGYEPDRKEADRAKGAA
jgi:hypothetical protein